ncbi:hypothetical protein U5B43_10485, partial [Campylobacter sp. 9BO]|uniref:hypothetical protein n=1 Tax=Campylobacter sp. 9BO TaxID=3424759 RepID=UPI003D358A58
DAGNTSAQTPVNPNIDTTPPVVTITDVINKDTDTVSDGKPNSTVVNFKVDDKDITDKDIEVTGPNNQKPTKVVKNPDSTFTATFDTPLKDGDKITVTATDKAGNKGKDDAEVGGTIFDDKTPPNKPTIEFVEDTNKDGKLNKDENSTDKDTKHTTAKITVPSDAVVGDKIFFKIDDKEPMAVDINDDIKKNGYSIKVPVTDNQTSKVTASIIDMAGNKGDEASKEISVD